MNMVPKSDIYGMITQIYENLYNQELITRREYDGKIVSRISLISIEFSLFMLELRWHIEGKNILFIENLDSFTILCLTAMFLVVQLLFFYKTFFRFKKNYGEVPIDDVRMFHLHIAKEKSQFDRKIRYQLVIQDDVELLAYLRDCYQRCTFINMKTNEKRAEALIVLDNLIVLSMLLMLVNCSILILRGGEMACFL